MAGDCRDAVTDAEQFLGVKFAERMTAGLSSDRRNGGSCLMSLILEAHDGDDVCLNDSVSSHDLFQHRFARIIVTLTIELRYELLIGNLDSAGMLDA